MNDVMLPLAPFVLPAVYRWIVESGKTPHILVDAMQPEVAVPEAYVQNGEIVLNLTPHAVRDLEMTNTYVSFRATFSGKIEAIYVPMNAILSIYAAENGRGMPFEEEGETLDFDAQTTPNKATKKPENPAGLHLVD